MGFAQVNFRIPQELKDKLEQSAKESGRSITAELVTRLEQSYKNESQGVLSIFTDDDLKILAVEVFKQIATTPELKQEFTNLIKYPQ